MTAPDESARILVVEDDKELAHLLELHLEKQNYHVDLAHDGRDGLKQVQANEYALLILDLMLPHVDGREVCQQLRAENDRIPILMLTALATESDKVRGLEMGADDYVAKPFSIRELMARVKALLRRSDLENGERPEDADEITLGALTIAPPKRKVWYSETPVALTAKEFDLLLLLARHPGRAYSREELLDEVWGYQYEGYSHTVNTHINRLRSKIEEDPSSPQFVQTVWGVGYRFAERQDLTAPSS